MFPVLTFWSRSRAVELSFESCNILSQRGDPNGSVVVGLYFEPGNLIFQI